MYTRHKEAIQWFGLKTKMNENLRSGPGHFFPRGAIINVFFGENIGYEKSGVRPALCVSNDTGNRKSGNIAVVPLTDAANKSGKPLLPTQYRLLRSRYTKLRLDSIVQCEDVRVISKERVGDFICFVNSSDMRNIDKRIRLFFGV